MPDAPILGVNGRPRPEKIADGTRLVHAALLHRSRLSLAVVLQVIGVPRVVTPRAPASEQNAPGCTTGTPLPLLLPPPLLLGLDAGEVTGAGGAGWEGAGVAR